MKQEISPEQVKIKKAIRVMTGIALRVLEREKGQQKSPATDRSGQARPGLL